MTPRDDHPRRGNATVADPKLDLIERAIPENHLTVSLDPDAVGVRRWSVREGDMVERNLLAGLYQARGQQEIRGAIADHAVVEVGEPRVRAHGEVRAEALNLEVAELDPLGALVSAEQHSRRCGRVAGSAQG